MSRFLDLPTHASNTATAASLASTCPLRTELARPCCLGASPLAQTTSAGVQGRELCAPASDGTAETAVRPRRTSGGRQRANDDEAGSAGDQGRGPARVRLLLRRAAGARGVCGDSSAAAAHFGWAPTTRPADAGNQARTAAWCSQATRAAETAARPRRTSGGRQRRDLQRR